MEPYRTQQVDRREIVVPVAGARDTQTLVLALSLLGAIVLLRAVIFSSVGHLMLAAAATLAVVGFYRSRSTRRFVLSRGRIALVERTLGARTLGVITKPEQVAIVTLPTGAILNDEPELSLHVVGDRGRISLRVLGKAAASELERALAASLAELELQATSQSLQGSIREQVLADDRVELSWRRPVPRSFPFAVAGLGGLAFALLVAQGRAVVGAVLTVFAVVAFATLRPARRTRLAISGEGFALKAVHAFGVQRSAGHGRLRASVFAVERERAGVFAHRGRLPADVDSRVWELALESSDGTRAIVGRELTPYELRWLAQRIDSVQESLREAGA